MFNLCLCKPIIETLRLNDMAALTYKLANYLTIPDSDYIGVQIRQEDATNDPVNTAGEYKDVAPQVIGNYHRTQFDRLELIVSEYLKERYDHKGAPFTRENAKDLCAYIASQGIVSMSG